VMPSKRPAPLSDAALAPRRTRDIGETNAGVPLPVKNTFIDVPSGLTPTGMHSASAARGQAISTAPAQVSFGFMKRAVLASSQAQGTPAAMVPATPSSPLSPTRFAAALRGTQVQPTSPRRVPALAVQRPSYTLDRSQILGQLPQTPLATPSPMGHNSLFSAERYQLFGGPAPVQEATHSAIAPTGGTCVLSTQGLSGPTVVSLSATQAPLPAGPLTSAMVGHMSTGPQTSMAVSSSMPVSSAPFTVVSSTTARSPATTVKLADGACGSRSAAVISTVQYARPAAAGALKAQRLNAVEQEAGSKDSHSEGDDDGDDDSDEGDQPKINIEDAPKPPPGALHPSLGSANHSEGTCKRCCFFPRNRCLNGYNCEFCHYEHEKRNRKSKKSKKKGKDSAAAADTETAVPLVQDVLGHAQLASGPQPLPPLLGMPGSILPGRPHLQTIPPPLHVTYAHALEGAAQTWGSQNVTYQWHDGIPGQVPPVTGPPIAPPGPAASYFATASGFALQTVVETSPPPPAYNPILVPAAPSHPAPTAAPALIATPAPTAAPAPTVAPTTSAAPVPVAAPASAPATPDGQPTQPAPVTAAPTYLAPATGSPVKTQPAVDAQGRGPAPPPMEAPKLPESLHQGEDPAPPPQGPPSFPPTVQPVHGCPMAPPPMSSPKLPKNIAQSLEVGYPPPAPGDSPVA